MSAELGELQERSFARATSATGVSYPPQRRLDAAQLASFLDRRAFAVVGSTRADGRAHAALSIFIVRGTTFWLPTMAGSVRERNLRRTPWLTMVIEEGNHPVHIAVIVEGPAEIVPPVDVPPDVQAAVTEDWVTTWIRVRAERLLSYGDEAASP